MYTYIPQHFVGNATTLLSYIYMLNIYNENDLITFEII